MTCFGPTKIRLYDSYFYFTMILFFKLKPPSWTWEHLHWSLLAFLLCNVRNMLVFLANQVNKGQHQVLVIFSEAIHTKRMKTWLILLLIPFNKSTPYLILKGRLLSPMWAATMSRHHSLESHGYELPVQENNYLRHNIVI